jgi:integrase
MSNEIIQINPDEQEMFNQLVETTLSTISDSTQRIYAKNYRQWLGFCQEHDLSPFDLKPIYVSAFINNLPVTRKTRTRILSAIRKLAQVLSIADERYARVYESLRLIKALAHDADNSRKQERKALSPAEVVQVLDAVIEDGSLRNARNRALIAVLFFTGMRRSEVAKLKWSDVDFPRGTIEVWEGKGNKDRTVAVVGDETLHRLWHWQQKQQEYADFEHIFCEVNKGDNLQHDKPISGSAVYNIVKEAETLSGVVFKPHDARRTLATELLNVGNPVHDVQAQLGHANASTTLDNYAKPADAEKRREKFNTRY